MYEKTAPAGQGGLRHGIASYRCEPANSPPAPYDASPSPATQATSTAPTRRCSHCGERFALKPRRGRNLSSHKRLHPTRYHEGARYCSDACRFAAHEARRQRAPRRSTTTVGQSGVKNAVKFAPGPNVLSIVGHATFSADISISYNGQNPGRASPKKPVLDPRIVPDSKWPGMYRVRRPDGSLSDMVNLTRAKDALGDAA